MSKAGKRLIEGAGEALEIVRGNQPAARITVMGQTYVPEPKWLPPGQCAVDAAALLLLGDSVPDLPDIRVGMKISGEGAEEIGYREYAKYGGWLIWNDDRDFYVIDIDAPAGWMPLPTPPTATAPSILSLRPAQ